MESQLYWTMLNGKLVAVLFAGEAVVVGEAAEILACSQCMTAEWFYGKK